ncbi:Aste57867_173 [Aphanomyces stellatus]|uniref:Aste57867_173 protein n=1 Tax=Aphanomyces stellatus TaxID=120398 RepID=A0A485K628_9STRA|nr:hypothetical protein As57867_000173 [Aphanomyces stellatus]VFT77399.1 Aste57867_173 [Aphanomyces stellatus]
MKWGRQEYAWLVIGLVSLVCVVASSVGLFLSVHGHEEKLKSMVHPNFRLLQDIDQLPIEALRHSLLSTVTTFKFEGSDVRAFTLTRENFQPTKKYYALPSQLVSKNIMFGMLALSPHALLSNVSPKAIWLDEAHDALKHLGNHTVINCTFSDIHNAWQHPGFLFIFDKSQESVALDNQVVLQARIMEQAHVWKWSTHVWGESLSHHSNIIQEVLPTHAQLKPLSAKHPSYNIAE